mgnify:CR=1 FL=1
MDEIIIPEEIHQIILRHVQINFPEEACGILAGIGNRVTQAFLITNRLHSPVKFYMEPVELLRALEKIENQNLDLVAIFHSHPDGPDTPSTTDIKEFLYPGVATLICYLDKEIWKIKSFMIEKNHFHEINLLIK